MAMMISKFHKLIQSRLLWIGFLVVIVFSFVIWGMVWPSDLDEQERLNAAGLLDGEPVTHGEFRSAYLSTYLGASLSMGREILSSPENEALLRRRTWLRVATLREAAKLGLIVTENELISAIRSNFTDEQGRYNPQQYQAFIQNLVRPMGFTAAHFEQHVREEILMQKLGSLIGRQAQVTPLEIRRTFDTLMDSFTVEYVQVGPGDVEDDIAVTEEDVRALFDENPERFRVPEQREVLYAAFPIEVDEEAEFSDEDIQDYYELNIDDFVRTETDEGGETRDVVEDLDEARDRILAALRREAALTRAESAATELAFRAIPGRDGRIPDFSAEAEQSGSTAESLPPFSGFDVPVEDAGPSFTRAAFELELGAFDRISIPIVGQERVYVIHLSQIHAPRIPAFEDVQEEAMEAAREQTVNRAIQARASALQEAARAGLAAGKTFAEALGGFDIEIVSPPSFTGFSGSSSEDVAVQSLVQTVVAFNTGEVTDPVPVPDGVILAYVAEREPADPESFGAFRDEIASAIRGRRAQGLFNDWQDGLLAPERFTDLQRQERPEDDLDEVDLDVLEEEEAEAARWDAEAAP